VRALVTGADGFVGRYLCRALVDRDWDVAGVPGPDEPDGLDLHDGEATRQRLQREAPDCIFHLAAQTFVPTSIAAPLPTYETNVLGTARLLEAARAMRKPFRFIFISSAEVYGEHATADLPLRENAHAAPSNPYAASKAAAESIVFGETRSFGVDAVVTRAFNHIGPGQSERFVVPAFARDLARIARGGHSPLVVGNLEPQRDFLDVRDVVDAYVALAQHGGRGEVYNVCSGKAVAIKEILRRLILISRVGVEVREDPARMRPVDVPLTYGDNTKLREATGWEPKIALQRSLEDVYRWALDRTTA